MTEVSPIIPAAPYASATQRRRTPRRIPTAIRHHGPGHSDREPLEQFVAAVFRTAYGARLRSFYPHLLALTDSDGSLAAVAGLRPAAQGPLFAEHYLDAPVEALITMKYGQQISRERIVEVGNLAPAQVGQARWLIAALTAFLHGAGFTWVLFTAVHSLSNAFGRLGLQPFAVTNADPRRLPAGLTGDWGSYYQAKPVVHLGELRHGYRVLSRSIGADGSDARMLWQAALATGRSKGGAFLACPAEHPSR